MMVSCCFCRIEQIEKLTTSVLFDLKCESTILPITPPSLKTAPPFSTKTNLENNIHSCLSKKKC